MKRLLFISMLCLLGFTGLAQNSPIKGKVTDTSGKGISDVSVVLQGTTKGTSTDDNGNFTLNVTRGENTIVFSSVGFKTVKRKVNTNKSTKLNVVLQEDITMLSEAIIRTERKLQVNKLNIKSLEAPMTTHTVGHKLLELTNATNIEDAAKQVPGFTSVNRYGGFQFFTVRGFENFVLLYDGVRDERHNIARSSTTTNLANVERIEVLKGPSGDLFGHSALGGIMNIIRKKPSYVLKGNANVTVGSFNTANVTLGIGGPISDKLRFRVDAGRNKTNGFRNVGSLTRNASVMFDYTPTDNDKFELLLQYSNDDYDFDLGIPGTFDGKPVGKFNPKLNYSDPADFLTDVRKELQFNYTHRFNDNISLTNKFFITGNTIRYLGDEVFFVDPDGEHFHRRNYGGYHFDRIANTFGDQIDLSLKFNTGNVKHKAIVGSSFNYLNRKRYYDAITVTGPNHTNSANTLNISVTDPITSLGQEKTLTRSEMLIQKDLVAAVYLQDWITFSDKFKVLLGARYDHYDNNFTPKSLITNLAEESKASQGNFTYRAAVSYQPVKDFLTIYGSTSSFFKPVRNHGHRNGKLFKPESGYQAEGGVKMEIKDKLHLTLSGFHIKKKNLVLGHSAQTQAPAATSNGFELDIETQPVKGLFAKFGYTFVNAKFVDAVGENAYLQDKAPLWSPKNQANLWLNYEFSNKLNGLGLGFGANYVDKTFQDAGNKTWIPAYTVLNGVIYYQTKNNIKISFNVDNLANTLYYSSSLGAGDLWDYEEGFGYQMPAQQIYPGKERNFKLSISYEF
ncbi:MAG: TonB-dependent receptor [Tenacibaculum sp.]|nr:TonB-dependent receptor [Tenacibaculum sp.]